ncbi:hypothetical protein CK203_111847 [Vitis vinifera]|uniref:Uncharacterized protein n=1 Tax=Vitis vinifera TaxID=29760 RepID=A0A438EU16_VITVI|nr:hypothetical protein CK203_111847 [Vitis vinifera]
MHHTRYLKRHKVPCPGHVAHKLTNRWNQIEAVQHVKGANRQTEDKYHIQAGSAYETIINGLFLEVVKSLGGGKFSKWEPLTLEEAGGLGSKVQFGEERFLGGVGAIRSSWEEP